MTSAHDLANVHVHTGLLHCTFLWLLQFVLGLSFMTACMQVTALRVLYISASFFVHTQDKGVSKFFVSVRYYKTRFLVSALDCGLEYGCDDLYQFFETEEGNNLCVF
jgi:hypothetical protein